MLRQGANFILSFFIGFWGSAWAAGDKPEMLVFKAKIMFIGIIIAAVLSIIDTVKHSK